MRAVFLFLRHKQFRFFTIIKRTVFLFLFIFLIPLLAGAQAEITEIMYDLEGVDAGREWVEVFNNSESEVDLSGWKFNDGSNHILNEPPKNGGRGTFIMSANGYAIFTDNAETFFSEHPDYGGILIDTVMSLNNTAAVLKLFNKEGAEVFSVNYNNTLGASGDGNSLQKVDGKWIGVSPTYGSQNVGQQENQGNQSGDSNFSNSSEQTSENISSQSSNNDKILFKENRIKAYVGEDKTGVSGADIEFIGEALGLKNYPLDYNKTKFVWNFGDGGFQEGRIVKHNYFFPGKYIAVLDVASGEYSASDRIIVNVLPNEIIISEISSTDSRVKIYNGSAQTIDISFWQFFYKNQNFIFPKNTFIRGKEYLTIPKAISGFDFSGIQQGAVKLLYPNGAEATVFSYNEKKADADKGKINLDKKLATHKNIFNKKVIKNSVSAANGNTSHNLATVFAADIARAPDYLNATSSENNEIKTGEILAVLNDDSENSERIQNTPFKWKWLFAAFGASILSGAAFFVFRKTKDN